MYLSVIIPAYNEERRIGETLRSIDSYLKKQSYDYEIIVVSDNSEDGTESIVDGLKHEIKNLRLISSRENHGKGHSVKRGMLEAKGDFLLFTDADNSTTIDHVEGFIPYLSKGFDVIIGSIAIKGHKIAKGSEPIWRRVMGKLGNAYIQILVVYGIYDTQRGFKLFSARAAKHIFPRLTVGGFGFDVEALALAKKFGYKIKELPVNWKNSPDSKVGIKAYFQVLRETIIIKWNLVTGKYN